MTPLILLRRLRRERAAKLNGLLECYASLSSRCFENKRSNAELAATESGAREWRRCRLFFWRCLSGRNEAAFFKNKRGLLSNREKVFIRRKLLKRCYGIYVIFFSSCFYVGDPARQMRCVRGGRFTYPSTGIAFIFRDTKSFVLAKFDRILGSLEYSKRTMHCKI